MLCPACHGLSYVSGWSHFTGSVLGETVLWGSVVAAVLLQSWLALLLAPVGLLTVGWLLAQMSSLQPIEKEAVAKTRRAIAYELAIGIVVVAAAAYIFAK